MTCTVTSLWEPQRSFLCELHGGSSLLQRCFALCEWPTAENWSTAAAALMQHLCVRGAILSLCRYYHFLFGTTRRRKLFMLTNLCHRLPSPNHYNLQTTLLFWNDINNEVSLKLKRYWREKSPHVLLQTIFSLYLFWEKLQINYLLLKFCF